MGKYVTGKVYNRVSFNLMGNCMFYQGILSTQFIQEGIMKNLDKIKETLFRIEPNNISFVKKLLPMHASQIGCKESTHAYVIYIDDDSKSYIDGFLFQADDEETFEQGTKFRNLISRSQPQCLKDILLLLEIYCCDMDYAHKYLEKFNNPSFNINLIFPFPPPLFSY